MRIAVAGATGLVGAQVVAQAEAAGHDVVRLSRRDGVDLLRPDGLAERLAGVEAVVDVTRSPVVECEAATAFFERVAANLGAAGHTAGVARTVVLSIVGIDRAQDFGWYAATLAHERAVRAAAPGPVVLRATQFHEFAEQVLDRALAAAGPGRPAPVMDVPTRPVESREVARMLLDLATGARSGDTELAGPRPERLVTLAQAVADRRTGSVAVVPGDAPASMRDGAMLPGPDAVVAGRSWWEWHRDRLGSGA